MYTLTDIKKAASDSLEQGIFLIVLGACKIPPHILLSINGKTFSINAKGSSIGQDISLLLKHIHQKQLETLFTELTSPFFYNDYELMERAADLFIKYQKAEEGKITCLTPIKDFCEWAYQFDASTISFVFELLPKLVHKGIISKVFHLYLEKHLQKHTFTLKTYSQQDVDTAISTARKKINSKIC